MSRFRQTATSGVKRPSGLLSHNDRVLAKRPRPAQLTAALLLAVYWAAVTLGSHFAPDPPGVLYDLWYSAAPSVAGIALAIAVGLYVARWWLLLAPLTPVLVLASLELAGHRSPWHDAGPPLTQYLWWPLLWPLVWFFVLPVLLGVSIRRGLGERGVGNLQRG
jgi:hypothetical protein